MITTETDEKIIKIVLQIFSAQDSPTTEMIGAAVHNALGMLRAMNQLSDVVNVDKDQLVKKIETLCNVYVPPMSTLDDKRGHQEWFSSRRAEIQWRFWERYQRYLENDPDMPPQVVRRLEDVSNQILSRLEDPLRTGPWDRRGMVVGQVQSGKTSNYTALICKAADAGYKLIVVLTGTHNSLRSQTQLRLDEGFLGFDSQRRGLFAPDNIRLGGGLLRGAELYIVHSLTNSSERGDFNLRVAQQANVMIGGDPVLLVVKKNASVLNNLLKWSTSLQSSSQNQAQSQVHGVPLLLIDDEADNASINTNPILDENGNPDPETDPTKINGLIRRLLNSFEQSAYIGYTATPFANIFITDTVTNEKFGEDLFPRSFIINLQPPSNYFGSARLFGLAIDPGTGLESVSALPLIRHVHDYSEWIPDKHKKEYRPGPLPQSVKQAIKEFILTCAARYVRGQMHEHNSMLIHVTRFTAVQSYVAEQVKDELSFLQQRLRYGDGYALDQIIDELKDLWDSDFVPTMQKFNELELTPVTWDQVKEVLYIAAAKIEVRKINGTAKDTLQYVEHPDGLSIICIGGDKLSRGLTLEGLSISYYLRASRMYDTLMQMGRWFGYRDGYTDLCRLHTTSELEGWYRDITAADEELRQMFEDMAAQEKTPEEYGLGVKTHPDGLMITAATKMRHGQKVMLSYSQGIEETVVFFEDEEINQQNLMVTERLIRDIDTRYMRRNVEKAGSTYTWDNVSGEAVVDFLTDYITHETARKVRSSVLNKYIKARMADNELVEWTIALISIEEKIEKDTPFYIADLAIGLTERSRVNDPSDSKYRIRRLVSPRDEYIDMSEEERSQALKETQVIWEEHKDKSKSKDIPNLPSGQIIRRIRPAIRGLLLLYVLKYESASLPDPHVPIVGFAISFPKSNRGEEAAVEYVVNNVYWQQEFGDEV
jgi:hypothetical protein